MKKWIKPIGFFLMGLFCARCDFLQGMYPLGIAVLSIGYMSKNFFYIFSGCVLGAITISFAPQEILINTLPYALFLPCAFLFKKRGIQRLYASMLLCFLVFLIPAASLKIDIYQRTVLVFDGLIALSLAPIIKRLYRSFNEINSRLSLEQADILALCCTGAIVVSSLPKTDVLGFDLRVFALLFTSSFALVAFEARGGIWASVTGIMWVLKGGDVTIALILITGGILAGMLQKKRGGVLLGFVLGDILISLFMLNTLNVSLGIVNILAGCLYTVFLKEDFVERLKRLSGLYSGVNDLEMHYIESLRQSQKAKIENSARMYLQLSKAFISVRHGETFKKRIVNDTLEVCADCNKKEYCHKNRKSDTIIELHQAAEKIIETGKITAMPLTLTARCVNPMALVVKMQEAFDKQKHYFEENPDSQTEMANQLKSVADMLFALSDSISELPQFDKQIENQARDIISSRIGTVKQVSCRKSGESHIISLSIKENTKDIGQKIVQAFEDGFLGKYRYLSGGTDKNGGFSGDFAPVPRYSVEAFALRQNKKGQNVCGDSFTYQGNESGKYIAAISDGAGSGYPAKKESESTLDLLEAFWDASTPRNEMFLVMNRLLLLKGEKEDYSTVDVTEFDLENGVMYWTKIGAVPGYILREGNVEKIESGALPMGIVTKINPVTTKKLVKKGDIIVLVSDGIYDGLVSGNEDEIKNILLSVKKEAPQDIANKILSSAKNTHIDDDMTVLVLKVDAA